jgi:hypothetical protein
MLETADLQRTLTALLEWAKSRDLVLGALDARRPHWSRPSWLFGSQR